MYPPVCTVVKVTDLDWYLHGHHTYYVSIKVANTAGLVKIQTSNPYIHDVQKPAEGVVLDIDTQVGFCLDMTLKFNNLKEKEKFEDIKGVIRSCKSKDRQPTCDIACVHVTNHLYHDFLRVKRLNNRRQAICHLVHVMACHSCV